jgi:phage gpG-like protein
MEFFLEVMGTKMVQTRFNRMGAAALSARPAFAQIAEYLFGIEVKTFEGQGRRGGGSWRRDTPEWLDRKIKMGQDPRINLASHALMESVTKPGATGQILKIRDQSLRLGSKLPYAAVSQKNRPFIKLLPGDRLAIRSIMRRHLMNAWAARV